MTDFDDYWDDGPPEEEPPEPEVRHDSKVDEAKLAFESFFEEHPQELFYERQLQVIFEQNFYHWITSKALAELRDEERIASHLEQLQGGILIRFYRSNSHRFWKRQANEIIELVLTFSHPTFTHALGNHGELMFDAALPTAGFIPTGRDVRSFEGKQWVQTGHNLDRIFQRDGIPYGTEIKNTLQYIPREEFQAKLKMCQFFGIRPLFVLRHAPKSYIDECWRQGGFTLVFKYQLYPLGHSDFAKRVSDRLQIPVDSPKAIAAGTVNRFLNWHLAHLPKPPQG